MTTDGFDVEEYQDLVAEGRRIRSSQDSTNWGLGDLSLKVETKYGERTTEKYANDVGVEVATLRNYKLVSNSYQFSWRRENLSWWHHSVVAARDDRLEWLQKASENKWSSRQMLTAIKDSQRKKAFYTVAEWRKLSPTEQKRALAERSDSHVFNSQDSDNIEWARWSWNPVTGCLHNCSYCYARDIATGRFSDAFPAGFVPIILPARLAGPANTKVPAQAEIDVGYQNVFTCSMADLFGRWVPKEWVDAVLDVVADNPQWNFLFLTKFALRLPEFRFPENAWIGATIDSQARIESVEAAFSKVEAKVKWLSCEPLLEPLKFNRLDLFDWMAVGGASKSTQTPEFRPPREWIVDLEQQARRAGCKVYEKTNLLSRIREYPGQPDTPLLNVADIFNMSYLQRDISTPATYNPEADVR